MPYPQCDYFNPAAPEPKLYSCMVEPPGGGGIISVGCAVHCRACTSGNNDPGERGTNIYGRRWLRPHAEWESRDGRGVYHFLRSGDPNVVAHWFPAVSYHELANVWEQGAVIIQPGVPAVEYFEHADGTPYTICDGVDPEPTTCDWAPYLYMLGGVLVTCWIYHGWGFPPGGSYVGDGGAHFECTGAHSDNGQRQIMFMQPGLYNTAFVGLGSLEDRLLYNTCTPNASVKCYGHRVGDEGSNCAAEEFDVEDYFNTECGGQGWTNFDWLYVNDFAASFVGDSPQVALRNAVMAWLESDRALHEAGFLNFDQLDSARRYQSPAVNKNAELLWYGRSFNLPGDPDPIEDFNELPAVLTLTGRCRKTGHAVAGEYVLVDANFRVNLILHRIFSVYPLEEGGWSSEQYRAVYPLIRVEVMLHLGVRVDVAGWGTKQIVQSWRPAEEQDPPIDIELAYPADSNFPIVVRSDTGAQIDTIDWKYEGEFVRPDSRLRWCGHLGHLSNPKTHDVFAHDLSTSHCCQVARGFNGWPDQSQGLRVFGMASHADAEEGAQHEVYAGSVQLAFNATFC